MGRQQFRLPTVFVDQDVDVESRTRVEAAAEAGNITVANGGMATTASGTNTSAVYTNNTGAAQFLEVCMFRISDTGHTQALNIDFQVLDDTDTLQWFARGNPENFPISMDPSLIIQDGWSIDLVVTDFSGTSRTVNGDIIIRG